MPKELTHWLLADTACAGLPQESRLRGIIEAHQPIYRGGAVLPDTLLHLFRGPHAAQALTLAHAFHDTSDNSFAPLIRVEEAFPDGLPPALMACLLGVITHIETDIVFHPFVYALTASAGIGRHYQIETDIDCYFIHNGTLPAHRRLSTMMSADTQETLVNACSLLFDPDGILPHSALKHAFSSHCRFQAMYDNTFWKLAVRFLAAIIGAPFSEQRHLFYPLSYSSAGSCCGSSRQEWRHPTTGKLFCSSLDDLANEVIQRTLALFNLIEEKGSLAAALRISPGENLLTGLHGVNRNTPSAAHQSAGN